MRKLIFATLGGASILLAATPAAAQYYGQGYGYNGYNHRQTVTVWVSFERRLANVRRSLDGVRPDLAYRLSSETNRLDRQIRFAARSNAGAYEVRDLDTRIGQLERRVAWVSRGDRYNRYNSNDGNQGAYERREYSDHDRQGPGDGQR